MAGITEAEAVKGTGAAKDEQDVSDRVVVSPDCTGRAGRAKTLSLSVKVVPGEF